MNKFIRVYDDIIPIELQDHFEKIVSSTKIPWHFFNNISNVEGDKTNGFSSGLYKWNDINSFSSRFFFQFLQVPYLLSNHLELNVSEIYRSSLFFMPPSRSPQTVYNGIHIDLEFPHCVCLYYINNSDGDTVFFGPDKKTEIKRITPKKGRIIFFSGNIYHCTSTPTQNRFVLNTSFLVNKFGKEEQF